MTSSNGFVIPIEVRPARRFALTYLALQGGAAALAGLLTPFPVVLRLLLCSTALVISAHAVRQHCWRLRQHRVMLSGTGEWHLTDPEGKVHRLELLRARSFWFPWLVGLTLRRQRGFVRIWVTVDSVGPDNWRRLRTRLCFP